jgi:PBP1b-binding outer membrane lipoprotein LpoB
MQNQNLSLIAVVFAAILLQGCSQQVDPAKVQADVTKAEADGQKKIIDAQAQLDQVVAQNNKDLIGMQADARKEAANDPNAPAAAASADIAKARINTETKAEAAEKVAEARCELQVGDANKACLASAKASYESAEAAAKSKRDAARPAQ